MTNIRPGDTVTVQIKVTEVAPYDGGQQIMGKMLPNGDTVGWLLPKEAAVTLHTTAFRVGDEVWLDFAQSKRGKVITMHTVEDEHFLWVMPHKERTLVTVPAKDARRID